MAVIQHEYELSIWKDVWARPTLFDENGNVIGGYLEGDLVLDEEKSAILSTDNMTFPGKAINIVFKTKINGTHDLTFDLPAKYVDPLTGKKTINYLHDLIDNETKIKLCYRNEWYTFYVKKVTEKREKNYMLYSYSCEDSFITELSKNGYKITFNEYTDHYIEEIHTFAKDILDGSEWQYDEYGTTSLCDLIEYQEEKLVCYKFKVDTTGINQPRKLKGSAAHHLYESDAAAIENDAIVYGFYSEVGKDIIDLYGYGTGKDGDFGDPETQTRVKQIIYVPNNQYIISGNTIDNKNCNYIVPVDCLEVVPAEDGASGVPAFHPEHRYGKKIVYNQYTTYNKALKRYVKRYTNRGSGTSEVGQNAAVYSFTKTHIMVPEIATDYAANGKDMTDTTGWAPEMADDKLTVDKVETGIWATDDNGIPTLVYDDTEKRKSPNVYGVIASNLTSKGGKCKIINTGPYSRNLTIDTPTTFALKFTYKWAYQDAHADGEEILDPKPTIYICQPIVSGIEGSYYKEIVTESSALDDDGNYSFNSTPLFTIKNVKSDQYYLLNFDNAKLKDGPLTNLFIVIEYDAATQNGVIAKDGTYTVKPLDFCIIKLEFFEAWTYTGEHTKGIPSGSSGVSILRSNNYIVPTYNQCNWMTGYIKYLHGQTELYTSAESGLYYSETSASVAYDQMQATLQAWENGISEDEEKYTLVTNKSIVSGKSFEEEVYFIEPTIPPTFKDPYVIFIDPKEQNSIQLEAWYNNYKYRTLKQEKSNRFNLSQQLSELFHVYPVYYINYYPNGKVRKKLYAEDGTEITSSNINLTVAYSRREKYLFYTDTKGGENKYGFKYGHNLNSITRNIDSTDVVSKMFVTDNISQYATDGICTIARATDNIGKDTFLFNFSYFIDRGLIDKERIENDLYKIDGNISTYNWSNFINEESPFTTDADEKYREDLKNYDSYSFSTVNVYPGFLRTLGEINSNYDRLAAEQAALEKHQLIVLEASVQTYTTALKSLREQLAKQKQLTSAYQKEKVNKKHQEYIDSCQRITSKIETYELYLESAQALYEMYADLYNRYECEMHFLLACKKKVEDKFNTKYEFLIKEGVWQDSKYLNDNAYFLDAEKVLADSCGPKITYTLSVTDLSMLDKYAFTDFHVGDVTYVEDYEFFGDNLDNNDKFYEEKTVVSAITCNLDNPTKNTISLQNYSTKFDDLFSRITAAVQSLTFNENIYQRAANFTTTGQLSEDSIQDTLDNNDLTLVGNQDVRIDGNGILVTDLRIPSNKVKIVGAGVYLTATGGNSWYGAFENGGINASLLTVGAINTKAIVILNEQYSNFLWDKDGITAYGTASSISTKDKTKDDDSKTIGSTFVRFNQYGLYFVKENNDFVQTLEELQEKTNGTLSSKITSHIMNNADVAITYDGFSINGGKRHVRFTSEDGLVMLNEDGAEVLRLGEITGLTDQGIADFWGLKAQGAYIEGKLYSEYIRSRTVNVGGTDYSIFDKSRATLMGGTLKIERTIVEMDEDNSDINEMDASVVPITTFGSSLWLGEGVVTAEEQSDGNDDETEFLVGSSVIVQKNGAFWVLASYDDSKKRNLPKLFYARKAVGGYTANTLNVECKLIAKKGLEQGSDEKLKRNIRNLDEKYLRLFDDLQVKTYQYKDEDNNSPLHIGLIAQDVIKSLEKNNILSNEIGVVSEIQKNTLGLNYTEILTLAIAKIQQLEKRIKQLENK